MKPLPFADLRCRPPLLALLVLSAALAAGPAAADWLVTREGGRVETRGAWTVKGKLVVFHTADGKLSSLRVAEVDLDASRRATEEAVAAQAQAAAEPEKPVERRKSVRVITDKDVRSAAVVVPPVEEGKETAPAPGPATGPGLVVESWKQESDPEKNHIVINGTIHNASGDTSVNLKVKVMIFDGTGAVMATSQAAVASSALSPGQKTAFKAEFPGYFSFATIKIEPEGRRLAVQPVDPAAPPPEAPENGG